MDQDFDNISSERIEAMQTKARPTFAPKSLEILNSLVKKSRSGGSKTAPFSPDNIPFNPNIYENQQPEKLPLRKKRADRQLFQVKRGSYKSRLQGSGSKPPNEAHVSSNSNNFELETKCNLEHFERKTIKINSSIECSLMNKKVTGECDSLTIVKEINNNEHPLFTDTKKISKNDGNSVSDMPELSSFSSPDLNGDISSVNFFTQSLPDTKKISKNCDSSANDVHEIASDSSAFDFTESSFLLTTNCDFNFIPPPIPAPTVACQNIEVYAEPNSTSLLTNLNLYKDQFQLLEDNPSKNQSIPPNKLDLQVFEVTSTVPGKEAQVLENKTSVSSDEDQIHEVQSSVSSDDQVVDSEQINEISDFLEGLKFKRSMPKNIAEKILNDLKRTLRYYFNGSSVKLYGSYWYDAAVTTSNINFALVTDPPIKNSYLLHMQKTLAKEMNGYKVSPFEEETNPKRSKICFIDNEHGISCELMFLGSTVSQYLKLNNMLKAIWDFKPKIKTLVIAIKLWAEACEINEVENGKLHSVGFVLLLLHYLQQLDKPLLPLLNESTKNWDLKKLPVENDSSIGELWLGLFKYYGYKFNWNEHVVTLTCKTPVTKADKLWDVTWIAIEDPFSNKNIAENVVSSVTAEYIISCFKRSYEYFCSVPNDSDSLSSGSDEASRNIRRRSSFKLSDCISRPPPIFCSDDDSDSENCYIPQRSAVQESFKFSKISEASLKRVDQVLREAYNSYILPYNHLKGREAFVNDLEMYIRRLYPDAKLNLFGSTVNGFAFRRSDLDICMTLNGSYHRKNSVENTLKRLVRHLRKKNDLKNVFGLYSAQIPIIKFNFAHRDWHCDLSFYNVLAVHNSKLLYKYSMMDERCKILGCALKLLTKKTCIADCSSKSLSSYSYILMVIHFLQQVNPPVLPVMPIHDKEVFEKEIDEKELERKGVLHNRNYWFYEDVDQLKKRYLGDERNTSTVGELWLEMLEYYLKFDYERAVSITEKDPVPSESLHRYARLINIEDPFLSKRNLGCIVSEGKAGETRRIFHRARMLFGNDYSCENMETLQKHYFSPSNLTGQIVKDIECFSCGGFGHEIQNCLKADPFKNRKPWNSIRNKTYKSNNLKMRKP